MSRAIWNGSAGLSSRTARGCSVAFYLDYGDTPSNRNITRRGRKIHGVTLLANLTAHEAKQACRDRCGHLSNLLIGIVDELVDDDFRVGRQRDRRLIDELNLDLTLVKGRDTLVVNNVVTEHKLLDGLAWSLSLSIKIHRRSHTHPLLRLGGQD